MAEKDTQKTENEGQLDEGQTSDADLPNTEASASTATRRRAPQPEGQTVPGGRGAVQGGGEDDGYANPVTAQGPGQASVENTITRQNEDDDSDDWRKSKVITNFRKITGIKASDVIGFNEQTRVIVTAQGGKYQLNQKGNQVKHLQGPPAPKSLEGEGLGDRYVDARATSPFTGTAALINASVHESARGGARGEVANQLGQDADSLEAQAELAREKAENASVSD